MTSSDQDPESASNAPSDKNSNMRTRQEQAEAIDRQKSLRSQLRALYGQVLDEPVPDNLRDLLDELERKDDKR